MKMIEERDLTKRVIIGSNTLPPRIVIYGVEGVGKSTFASKFPNPFFIDVEDRTRHLDVIRFIPSTFVDLTNALDSLIDNRPALEKSLGVPIKTVVIDTLDWLQKQVVEYVCISNSVPSIESFGYGKGWTLVAENMAKVIRKLDILNRQGLIIVCVAHSTIRKFEDPMGSTYDRFTLKLLSGDRISVVDMFKEWCDCLLFVNYLLVNKENSVEEIRTIFTERTSKYDAKNSWGLPKSIELDKAEELIKQILNRKETDYEDVQNQPKQEQ